MSSLKPVTTVSATLQIAEQIRSAILDGTFKSGEQLPTETEMAGQFRVSRPTIREALKRLAAQNLITSRRGPTGGTFVRNYQIEDAAEAVVSSTILMMSLESVRYSEIIDVRRFMEFHCCCKVMENWSLDIGVKIDRALDKVRDPLLDEQEFCDADLHFHRTIVDDTGNPMLKYLMYAVIEALVPVMSMNIVYVRDRNVIIRQYEALRDGLFRQSEADVKEAIDSIMAYLLDLSVIADENRMKSA